MRCPVLVGRSAELGRLEAALATARSGRGAWLGVAGEAGIGKTRIVTEAARRCVEAGGQAAVGRCSPLDQRTPFRPLAEALLACARDVDRPDGAHLAPYVPAVARFVPHWGGGDAGLVSESPAVIGESLLRVLGWLAGEGGRPLLAVLEDLHWADPDTLAVADYLAEHVDGVPVVVLATARLAEAPPAVAGLLRRHDLIELPLLSGGEVAAIAAACLGRPIGVAAVGDLEHATGGLPLLVEDLLDDDDGRGGGSPRFSELVRGRLDRLSPPARRAAVAAALLGEHMEWRQLRPLASPEAVHELAAAQLILRDGEGFRFRHALTRDVVLEANPALAAELSGPVAGVLEDGDGDADLARAAELQAGAGEPDRAVTLFRKAAGAAQARGAPAAALALLDRAADLAPSHAARVEIDLERLDHLVRHGQVERALDIGTGLLDATAHDDAASATVHRLLARAHLDGGRPDAASQHLDRAAGPGVSGRAEALVLRARIRLAATDADGVVAAEHLAHQAFAAAEEEGRPAAGCEALDVVARAARTRSLADAEVALRRSLALAADHDLTAWRLRILNELGTVEMLRTAEGARLQRAYDEAMALGALDVAAGTAVNLAALLAMRAELDEGLAASDRAEDTATRLGLRPLAAAAVVIGGVCEGFRGRQEAMERRFARAERIAPGDADRHAFTWGAGRGLCALVREERANALAAFRQAVGTAQPVSALDTGYAPMLVTLAAGGDATASDLAAARAAATPGAGWSELWLGFGEAAMAGAAGDHVGAAHRLATADEAGRRHPLFRAIALRLVAEAALRDGWGNPVAWLRDAEAVFVAGGQDRIASACRTLLRQGGASAVRRRGADRALPPALLRAGVTAREAGVLELVGERLSNKDIAGRLYLSARTVEKHVASLLTKLDAGDRATLIRVARQDGGAVPM